MINVKKNSLAVKRPDLIKEWHPTKNNGLKPEMFHPGSNEKVWWICPSCGYEWQSTIGHVKRNNGCPYCNGKVVIEGKNDLKS